MSIRAFDAANAYAQSLNRTMGAASEELTPSAGASEAGASSFGAMLGDVFSSAVDASRNSEAMTARSIAGKADLIDVVSAVNNAEMAVETLVAVRDRMVSAYQEILRMPI